MAKQLMIYDNIQPLTGKHLKWSVNLENYDFVAHMNSSPVLANEIPFAANEYPIVFSATATPGEYIPLAILGLKEGENLFLNEKKLFVSRYVPAFIRRYPFVLGGNKDSEMMAICIDEDSKIFVQDGSKGERLFDDNGEQSVQLKEIVEFLKDYQQRAEITKIFCKRLHDLDLLEPMQANITFKNNEAANINLTGFYVVKREKLRTLNDADILDIFKKDGMEIIYAHLQSLSNLNRLIELMADKSAT